MKSTLQNLEQLQVFCNFLNIDEKVRSGIESEIKFFKESPNQVTIQKIKGLQVYIKDSRKFIKDKLLKSLVETENSSQYLSDKDKEYINNIKSNAEKYGNFPTLSNMVKIKEFIERKKGNENRSKDWSKLLENNSLKIKVVEDVASIKDVRSFLCENDELMVYSAMADMDCSRASELVCKLCNSNSYIEVNEPQKAELIQTLKSAYLIGDYGINEKENFLKTYFSDAYGSTNQDVGEFRECSLEKSIVEKYFPVGYDSDMRRKSLIEFGEKNSYWTLRNMREIMDALSEGDNEFGADNGFESNKTVNLDQKNIEEAIKIKDELIKKINLAFKMMDDTTIGNLVKGDVFNFDTGDSEKAQNMMYNDDGTLKSEMLKLAARQKSASVLTSKDLENSVLKIEKAKEAAEEIRSAMNTIKNNPRVAMNDGDNFVQGHKLLEKYNEKLGLSKDKVHHIVMAASQTNGLESPETYHSLISDYLGDPTQGPTSVSQSMKALLNREAEYQQGKLKEKDTARPLVEKLAELGVIYLLYESDKDIGTWVPTEDYRNKEVKKFTPARLNRATWEYEYLTDMEGNKLCAFYKDGYIQPYALNDDGKEVLMDVLDEIQCSYMSQDCESNDASQRYTQNFAAAFSYQHAGAVHGPRDYLMNFKWVYPQYNNIIRQAITKSASLPDDNLIMVHLTSIGQGVFSNPPGIAAMAIAVAILENSDKLEGSNIMIQKEWNPLAINPKTKMNDLASAVHFVKTIKGLDTKLRGKTKDNFEKLNESSINGNFKYLFNDRTICVGINFEQQPQQQQPQQQQSQQQQPQQQQPPARRRHI